VTPRRLYRSRTDRQLAGIAGGIARYLDVDPTVVRIAWILSVFFGGFGILLYIIMAFIVPLEPTAAPPPGWTPGGPAWGAPPAGGTTGEPAADATGDGEPGSAPTSTSAAWADPSAAAPNWATNPSWDAHGAAWQPAAERGPGRGPLVLGVLLVAFGGIALAGTLVPGWIAWPALGPAFLVALGVALLVGAIRRTAAAS
jgi:phage shock protein PspC (stress-responsive transcriptional regulator)